MHLECGDNVVLLEGGVEEVGDIVLLARFADAYEAKYRFRPRTGNPAQVVYRLRPRTALSWREGDFPKSATRWRFALVSRFLTGNRESGTGRAGE